MVNLLLGRKGTDAHTWAAQVAWGQPAYGITTAARRTVVTTVNITWPPAGDFNFGNRDNMRSDVQTSALMHACGAQRHRAAMVGIHACSLAMLT